MVSQVYDGEGIVTAALEHKLYGDEFTALEGWLPAKRSRDDCIIFNFIPRRSIYIYDMRSIVSAISNAQLPLVITSYSNLKRLPYAWCK